MKPRMFKPLMSALTPAFALHFARVTEKMQGDIQRGRAFAREALQRISEQLQ
jgi:hypothetical protein